MDIRKVFGVNARKSRLALGLSQEAVAERMGVDRAFISSLERGLQNATLYNLGNSSGVRGSAYGFARRENIQGQRLAIAGGSLAWKTTTADLSRNLEQNLLAPGWSPGFERIVFGH